MPEFHPVPLIEEPQTNLAALNPALRLHSRKEVGTKERNPEGPSRLNLLYLVFLIGGELRVRNGVLEGQKKGGRRESMLRQEKR